GTVKRDVWECPRESRLLGQATERLDHEALMWSRAAARAEALQGAAHVAAEAAKAEKEAAAMAYEELDQKYWMVLAMDAAAKAAKDKALQFSIDSLQGIEGGGEDWRQCWEPFENGSDWR
ncbi:unnamed protein product, partial [Chrysoparadoxa australica]